MKCSDGLENVYDGIIKLGSTGSDDVEEDTNSVHRRDKMTLRSGGKSKGDVAGGKP